jgi:hypothetical protein
MKKDRWIEILVVIIIIGTLAYLSKRVMDMSATLGGVDVKTSWTAERLNRIAAALPDIGIRVADEELSRTFQTAVVATKPFQAANGGWELAVTVLDAQSSKKWTLPVRLGSKADRQAIDTLLGIGAETDRDFLPLSRLQQYAWNAHSNGFVPAYVDAKASFVLYNASGEEFLAKIANKMVDQAHEAVFGVKVEDYKSLIKALESEQGAFTLPKQEASTTPTKDTSTTPKK